MVITNHSVMDDSITLWKSTTTLCYKYRTYTKINELHSLSVVMRRFQLICLKDVTVINLVKNLLAIFLTFIRYRYATLCLVPGAHIVDGLHLLAKYHYDS